MKIAFIRTASNQLRYGSYNIQEIGLAQALLKYSISIDIYARFSNIDKVTIVDVNGDAKIRLLPLKGKKILKEVIYYSKLKNYLCFGNYDIAQLLDDSQMMLPYLFYQLKKRNISTVLWQGMYRNFSGKFSLILQKLYDYFFASILERYSDIKIAKTSYAKEYLNSKGYTNIITLPVGLNIVECKENNDLTNIINDFKRRHKNILLYVGVFEKRRNIVFLLNIMQELKKHKIGLILIGNGPQSSEIDNLIEKYLLKNYILKISHIKNNEMHIAYKLSDLLVLPTSYEIFGMVILEALYYGLPVFSTPEAGPNSILEQYELGVCENLDTEKWIKGIIKYLDHDKLKENADYRSKFIIENYNWDEIGKKYYNIITKLLQK